MHYRKKTVKGGRGGEGEGSKYQRGDGEAGKMRAKVIRRYLVEFITCLISSGFS